MSLRGFGIVFLIMLATSFFAQKKVKAAPVKFVAPKKESNFGIGFGLNSSVIYLPRSSSNSNGAAGRSLICTYDKGNYLRFTFEYNKFQSPDFAPTWYNVQASSFESNVQYITRFMDGHGFLYPMAGLSYNLFKGYFTGKNDYLNLRALHQENTTVTSNWLGLNVGVGYDYKFRNSAIFMMYKIRIGYTEGYNQCNIQDICFSVGYRIHMDETLFKKIFLGPRSRYALPKSKLKPKQKTKTEAPTSSPNKP